MLNTRERNMMSKDAIQLSGGITTLTSCEGQVSRKLVLVIVHYFKEQVILCLEVVRQVTLLDIGGCGDQAQRRAGKAFVPENVDGTPEDRHAAFCPRR